jgi:mannose-6-phosphate isomerase-like protein (cupin superfamily)
MLGFVDNIEEKTAKNSSFREVLFTGKYTQLVVMSLGPMEDIGYEVHEDVDQFFRIEEGVGKIVIDGEERDVKDGFAIVVPAGANHNLINTSNSTPLKLYTLYSPPNHPEGTVHKTKKDAIEHEHHFGIL